ncbi:hypothetical protein QBC44DRAFT_302934 [Cladorrhinum sp. PSN332]|nr:hypothetical protein QBC44DRAFT_302934 [Cladorrhinum sp. PSN332]
MPFRDRRRTQKIGQLSERNGDLDPYFPVVPCLKERDFPLRLRYFPFFLTINHLFVKNLGIFETQVFTTRLRIQLSHSFIALMEVAGLVIGIVSLCPACHSCYTLFSEAEDSVKNATVAAQQPEIQQLILKAWVSYWEISPELVTNLGDPNQDGQPKKCDRLETYLKQRNRGEVG